MKIDSFERLLISELNESLSNNPELWTKSKLGIKRNDGLYLCVDKKEISISQPEEYEFKNSDYKKILHEIAYKLYREYYNKWETELFNKIIISLKNPDSWTLSIWGIKQKGDYFDTKLIELKISDYDNKMVSVKVPEHEFNSTYTKTLKVAAHKALDCIVKKDAEKKLQKNKDELFKFFNFDDRKHKLKMLKIIATENDTPDETVLEVENEVEEEIVEKKLNIFSKFFNLFLK